jgi:site-specific DNA recombinase
MTTTNTGTITAREYLRVSYDKSKRERSIEEQHADNERAAAARGVTFAAPYREEPMSASRYGTKTRDEFARLLADLEHGRFNADELWLWEPSRGSRRISEWARLIEACEAAGVVIYVTSHRRCYDPANGRDRHTLHEDANDSEYESYKTSERVSRAVLANAEAGLPHGPTPYGYRRIYDPQTRRLVRQEPDPDEAPIVRDMYERFSGGESLYAIAKDLESRGVTTRKGAVFTARLLRDVLMSPTYAGWRTHNPGSNRNGTRWCLDGKVQGTWEPLVSEDTYRTVRATLENDARRSTRPAQRAGKARHLLSFTAVCDVCGGPLVVSQRRGSDQYQCHKGGHVRVDKADLDELAETVLLDFLSRKDAYQGMTAADTDGAQLRAVRADLAVARSELDELRAGVAAGRLAVANLTAVEPGLLARVKALQEQEQELTTPSVLRGLFQPGPGAAKRWRSADPLIRRQVARILLTPEHLGQLRVDRRPPNSGSRRVPAERRVVWKTAD